MRTRTCTLWKCEVEKVVGGPFQDAVRHTEQSVCNKRGTQWLSAAILAQEQLRSQENTNGAAESSCVRGLCVFSFSIVSTIVLVVLVFLVFGPVLGYQRLVFVQFSLSRWSMTGLWHSKNGGFASSKD